MYNAHVIRLLQSLNTNFPILNDWGYVLGKPIALVFDNLAEAISVIKKTSIYPRIIDASTKVETTKKYLEEANSEGVFVVVQSMAEMKSVKIREKIEAVFSAATIGELDSRPVCAATYIVFQKSVPDEFRERVFELHFTKQHECSVEDILDLVPSSQQLSVVKDRIQNMKEKNPIKGFWKAVAAFMYPRLNELGRRAEYDALDDVIERIVQKAEIYKEEGSITEVFTDCLITFLNKFDASKIFILPELDSEAELSIQEAVFVKKNFLFFHETLFRGIVKELIALVPIDVIKGSLAKQGVLQGDSGGYTTKMVYFDQKGQMHRVRMMKLNTEKLSDGSSRLIRNTILFI